MSKNLKWMTELAVGISVRPEERTVGEKLRGGNRPACSRSNKEASVAGWMMAGGSVLEDRPEG